MPQWTLFFLALQPSFPFGIFGQHREAWTVYQVWRLSFCVAWVCHCSEIQLPPQLNETNSLRAFLLTASGYSMTWWVWMGSANVKELPAGTAARFSLLWRNDLVKISLGWDSFLPGNEHPLWNSPCPSWKSSFWGITHQHQGSSIPTTKSKQVLIIFNKVLYYIRRVT